MGLLLRSASTASSVDNVTLLVHMKVYGIGGSTLLCEIEDKPSIIGLDIELCMDSPLISIQSLHALITRFNLRNQSIIYE